MIQRLADEHRRSVKEVFDANSDFPLRLATSSINTFYDRDGDTFYLTIGEPQDDDAVYESVDEDRLLLRLDPDNLRIRAIEVPDVSVRLSDDPLIEALLRPYLAVLTLDTAPASEFMKQLAALAESA